MPDFVVNSEVLLSPILFSSHEPASEWFKEKRMRGGASMTESYEKKNLIGLV